MFATTIYVCLYIYCELRHSRVMKLIEKSTAPICRWANKRECWERSITAKYSFFWYISQSNTKFLLFLFIFWDNNDQQKSVEKQFPRRWNYKQTLGVLCSLYRFTNIQFVLHTYASMNDRNQRKGSPLGNKYNKCEWIECASIRK